MAIPRNSIIHGDCLAVLAALPPESVDAIVTDPPYGLSEAPDMAAVLSAWLSGEPYRPRGKGFMGKEWDAFIPGPEVWRECYRVLKPGGHLLAFAGTRTFDLMGLALRLAGFELRDTLQWLYGCLSEDSEILTEHGWERYHTLKPGTHALCYNVSRQAYEWQRIQEVYTYEYRDTAYHVHGDGTDQLLSRQHRALVQRGGGYAFQRAETLPSTVHVPVLENVRGVLQALPVPHALPSYTQAHMLSQVWRSAYRSGAGKPWRGTARRAQRVYAGILCRVRQGGVETASMAQARPAAHVLTAMQWGVTRARVGKARAQRERGTLLREHRALEGAHAGRAQSRLEGRRHGIQAARQLCGRPLCTLPRGVQEHGTPRRLRDGAPPRGGSSARASTPEVRGGTPRQPRPHRQPHCEPHALCQQPRPQALRASRYTRAALATVEPVWYEGVVWCVRVPSGAFVARRNGKAFVTGNSGFPKSLDVALQYEQRLCERVEGTWRYRDTGEEMRRKPPYRAEEANTWAGWGSALKPAYEPVLVCRKPLAGTVAENVLRYGTGALNIDASRVESPDTVGKTWTRGGNQRGASLRTNTSGAHEYLPANPAGRWPPNLLLSHTWACTEEECAEGCPVRELGEQSGERTSGLIQPWHVAHGIPSNSLSGGKDGTLNGRMGASYGDTGTAARYFPQFRYVAKASTSERNRGLEHLPEVSAATLTGRKPGSAGLIMPNGKGGNPYAGTTGQTRRNTHPTVKPLALMRWLVRLVAPPGGIVLDCYAGSGTTLLAAYEEGFAFLGIEREAEYIQIASGRLAHALAARTPTPRTPRARRVAQRRVRATQARSASLWEQ